LDIGIIDRNRIKSIGFNTNIRAKSEVLQGWFVSGIWYSQRSDTKRYDSSAEGCISTAM